MKDKVWFSDNREVNLYAQIPEDLIYDKAKEMPIHTVRVYGVLDRHINKKTGDCFPGHRRISEKTGISRSQIQKSLDYLEAKGFIRVVREDGKSNRYELMPVGNLVVVGVAPQEGQLLKVAPPSVQGGPSEGHLVAPPSVHNESSLTKAIKQSNNPPPSAESNVVPISKPKPFNQKFVDWFGAEYAEHFGKPYAPSQADFVQAARCLKAFSASDADFETLKKLVFAGWADTIPKGKNAFVMADACMTVKGFCASINNITLSKPKKLTAYEQEQREKKNVMP